jgi:hypothetical protein
MLAVLRNLEPRQEEPDVALVEELDEFNEVVFFMKGFYRVGYSINNQNHFYPEAFSTNVIGAYGATFYKRSLFMYKTHTRCEGFFIRKKSWQEIIQDDEVKHIVSLMKVVIEDNYKKVIETKLLRAKMVHLKGVFARHDYDNVMAVTFLNKDHATQTPGQIVNNNKNAFDKKTGVDAKELTKMANG